MGIHLALSRYCFRSINIKCNSKSCFLHCRTLYSINHTRDINPEYWLSEQQKSQCTTTAAPPTTNGWRCKRWRTTAIVYSLLMNLQICSLCMCVPIKIDALDAAAVYSPACKQINDQVALLLSISASFRKSSSTIWRIFKGEFLHNQPTPAISPATHWCCETSITIWTQTHSD